MPGREGGGLDRRGPLAGRSLGTRTSMSRKVWSRQGMAAHRGFSAPKPPTAEASGAQSIAAAGSYFGPKLLMVTGLLGSWSPGVTMPGAPHPERKGTAVCTRRLRFRWLWPLGRLQSQGPNSEVKRRSGQAVWQRLDSRSFLQKRRLWVTYWPRPLHANLTSSSWAPIDSMGPCYVFHMQAYVFCWSSKWDRRSCSVIMIMYTYIIELYFAHKLLICLRR